MSNASSSSASPTKSTLPKIPSGRKHGFRLFWAWLMAKLGRPTSDYCPRCGGCGYIECCGRICDHGFGCSHLFQEHECKDGLSHAERFYRHAGNGFVREVKPGVYTAALGVCPQCRNAKMHPERFCDLGQELYENMVAEANGERVP